MLVVGWLMVVQSDTDIDYSNFRKEPAYNQEIDFDHINYKKIDEVIFHLTNEIRAKNNLKPLEYDPLLAKSASMHARDMVEGNFFAHINERNAKKRTPNDRAKLCAIINPILAENLIQGFGLQYKSYETAYLRGKGNFSSTPDGELIKAHTYLSFGEAQLNGWMNSKDHRKNILSKDALQLGCGAAYYIDPEFNYMPNFYVVQVFQLFEPIKKE
jgi:uncharacterized protein YkwD